MLVPLDIFPVTYLEDLIISTFFLSMYIEIDDVRSQKKKILTDFRPKCLDIQNTKACDTDTEVNESVMCPSHHHTTVQLIFC